MEIKIELSEQERLWLEQITTYEGLSADAMIKILIKEKHETLAMDLAFEQYPAGKSTTIDDSSSRSGRKAALKRALIERASTRTIEDSGNEI